MVFEDASPDECSQMFAALPQPCRLAWQLVGRRSDERWMRELRGPAA